MGLTEEQVELLEEIFDGPPEANPGQSAQQVENFGISSFQYVCQFLGLDPVPSEQDVRAAWRERYPR